MALTLSLGSGCGGSDNGSQAVACQAQSDCEVDQICVAELCVDRPVVAGRPRGGTDDAGGLTPPTGGFPGASCDATIGCDAGVHPDGGARTGALSLQPLPFVAQDLAADPPRKRVYATVSGAADRYANQLVTLDATTGEVLAGVHVGSDPSALALTHDGTSLWVSLAGAQAVRRVDLTTALPTPAEQHTLPSGSDGERAVPGQVIALPDHPRSIVVSRLRPGFSPSFAGLIILDDGVLRPQNGSRSGQASRYVAGEPGYLFGYNNESTGFDFEVVTLGPTGRTHAQHHGLMDSFANDIVYADKRIFARGGEVIDVSSPSAPMRVGKFAVSGSLVEPVDATTPVMIGRAVGGSFTGLRVHVLDTATFTIRRSIEVGNGNFSSDVGAAVQADPASVFFLADSYGRSGAAYLLKTNDGRPLAAQ